MNDNNRFKPGDMVCLKSNKGKQGAVVAVIPGTDKKVPDSYEVFMDNKNQTFFASQLQSVSKEDGNNTALLSYPELKSYLTSLQIRNPGISTLYSLNAARIDFIPYQFRPVLKFIRSDIPRLLIADSVGVGKTIEAGLILRELQARKEVDSVLIICPRPMIAERKWELEMKRFEEDFAPLDGETLKYCINELELDGEWPERYKKAILPYSLFNEDLVEGKGAHKKRRRTKDGGLLGLDPPPRFDMVIVDEAHHIRNSNTYAHKAVRLFCEHAEAVLFLTATPIQMGNDDLFNLLHVLREDLITDKRTLEQISQPNPYINKAVTLCRSKKNSWNLEAIRELEKAESTSWGQNVLSKTPEFKQVKRLLSESSIDNEGRVRIIDTLEELHTLSPMINRTRRRDIGDFTVRKSETAYVDFTPSQREFYYALLHTQERIYSELRSDMNLNFLMTSMKRQTASCIYGLAPHIEDMLARRIENLTYLEEDIDPKAASLQVESFSHLIKPLIEKARNLDLCDPKLELLRGKLREKREMQNKRVMVFSTFIHTLSYLYEHLKQDGFRVGLVHGATPDEERLDLRERFAMDSGDPKALDVLLFSEVGCEGLDYQFCDCIINYDLPWNPMKIEQRIGRIDRNGQKSESVAIINLITQHTIDAAIYERCLQRIGVFEREIGGNEEILGKIGREILSIAGNFKLTENELDEKLRQMTDNELKLITENERLEERQLELFGLDIPTEFMNKKLDEASSFWLSPDALLNHVNHYLRHRIGREQEFILGASVNKTLQLGEEARKLLLEDFRKLHKRKTKPYREWERWLKGGTQYLKITFDREYASRNKETVFITPVHPLINQASAIYKEEERIAERLKVADDNANKGCYPFVIYQWKIQGLREDVTFKFISSSDYVGKNLPKLLEKAEASTSPNMDDISEYEEMFADINARHYGMWSDETERHKKQMIETAGLQRASLKASYDAQMSLLEEPTPSLADEDIQRMRLGQIENKKRKYKLRDEELANIPARADIMFTPVVRGIIEIY